MKHLLACAVLAIMVTGCTTYDVRRTEDGVVTVKVRSTRNFEQPDLRYSRVGEDASFEFGAESATSENMAETYMYMLQSLMRTMMGVPPLTAPPSNAVSPGAPVADSQ